MDNLFKTLLNDVPDYSDFLTWSEFEKSSDDLAMAYPDIVSLDTIGTTRAGHPLRVLKIGSGDRTALLYGCPHPNEPIGAMMLEYLSGRLARDEELRKAFNCTFYILKVWDIDGYLLNEGWLKGPFSIRNYSRGFFRPAMTQQVDWTFPVDCGEYQFHNPIPETVAMMQLIDAIHPDFCYALHNCGFGGVYWYAPRSFISHYEALKKIPEQYGIPLNLGEPEAPFLSRVEGAFYDIDSGSAEAQYNYLISNGIEYKPGMIEYGDCSSTYAGSRYNSFCLLTEEPFFMDPRIQDTGLSTVSRREAINTRLDIYDKAFVCFRRMLVESGMTFSPDNPFLPAVISFASAVNSPVTRNLINTDPAYTLPATNAELFDNILGQPFYLLLNYGMLVRVFEYEQAHGNTAVSSLLQEAFCEYSQFADQMERDLNYTVVPIRNLIRVQLASGIEALTSVISG